MFLRNIPKEYVKSVNSVIYACAFVVVVFGVILFKAKFISIKSDPPAIDITLAKKQAEIINNAQGLIIEATTLINKTASQPVSGYGGPVAMHGSMQQSEEYKVSVVLTREQMLKLNKINADLQQLKGELQALPQSNP